MRSERLFDRERLELVVVRRRCSVSVDIPDLVRRDTGVFKRSLHDPSRARSGFIGHREMKRVSARSIADELSVNLRATSLRRLELFEDHDPRAFTDNETIAISLKRP